MKLQHMTMIACTIKGEVPVMLADILITGNSKSDGFVLPSRNEDILGFLTDDDDHPVRLLRKIYIPANNVCIAFAGDVALIKKFLEDLIMFCKIHGVVDRHAIFSFATGYGLTDEHDIAFLIIVADIIGDRFGVLKIQRGAWNETVSPLFGSIVSAGSGAEDFLKEAMEEAEFFTGQPADSIEIVLQSNIILLCKLLSGERISLKNIKNYWGAGFEMVYLLRRGFTRFDDITYIINHAAFDVNGDIEIPIPEIIMHYRYQGDVLIITAINPLNGTTETREDKIIIRYKEFNVKQFIVEPVYDPGNNDNYQINPDTSFTSHRIAMGYVIQTPNGDYVPASFNYGIELVVDYKHMESVTITMVREMNDTITALAKSWFEKMHF